MPPRRNCHPGNIGPGEGKRGNTKAPGCNWSGISHSLQRSTHRVPSGARVREEEGSGNGEVESLGSREKQQEGDASQPCAGKGEESPMLGSRGEQHWSQGTVRQRLCLPLVDSQVTARGMSPFNLQLSVVFIQTH